MSRYRIKYIEKANAPDGMAGENWFRYVIENEYNSINGYRAGTKKDVLKLIKESVKRLNEKYATNYKTKNFNRPANETGFAGFY